MPSRLLCTLELLGADALLDDELAALAFGASRTRARAWLAQHGPQHSWRSARRRALLALAKRIAERPLGVPVLTSAKQAVALLRARMGATDVEELYVLALDARNRVLAVDLCARGGVAEVAVYARDVFRPLVAVGATRAIVAHNHPSGDPTPSQADRELTVRLAAAGDLLGIRLLDHLVLGQSAFYSFAETSRPDRSESGHPSGIR